MPKEQIAGIVLSSATTICAMLVALVAVLMSMSETARHVGIIKGRARYQYLIYLSLAVLVAGVLSALFAFFFLLGATCLYVPALVLFVVLVVGSVVGTIVIAITTK